MDDTEQHTIACRSASALPTAPACLVVIHGDGFGLRVDIHDDPVVVGRAGSATLCIASPSISRLHCEIRREGDLYRIRDLGSTNATRIGGRAVEDAILSDGDQITVGESVLKFVSHTNVEAVYHAHVSRLMFRDRLTGLLGRQDFVAAAEARIAAAIASRAPLSLVLIDLEDMAAQQLESGDEACAAGLTRIAGTLEGRLDDGDLAARIGECRLAVLLAGRALPEALAFVASLRDALSATGDGGAATTPVSILAGAAQLEDGIDSLGQLIKRIRLAAAGG